MRICCVLSRIQSLLGIIVRDPMRLYYRVRYTILSPIYQNVILPPKVRKVRKKSVINVLFVLNELGSWKTESLYKKMKDHPRFNVRLLLIPAKETPNALVLLKQYLQQKGYEYEDIDKNDKHWKDKFDSDIIFYQKPYDGVIDDKYFFT